MLIGQVVILVAVVVSTEIHCETFYTYIVEYDIQVHTVNTDPVSVYYCIIKYDSG